MKTDTIYCTDACEQLERTDPEWVDLVFADPPYNIGYVYDNYRDDLSDEKYVEWSRRWMSACARALKPNGSIYIAIGDDFAADLRIVGRDIGLHLRNWIIWHYTFGQNMKNKFSRSHTHILYFTKHPSEFTFNDRLLRFPSARHTEYQDLRANPRGRLPNDVWDEFPRVCGTFKERDGIHGCQMPEALLMRIIMASSNRGDVVLDPFVGSGTTAIAARRLGRQYVGIDISETYVELTRKRLARVNDEIRDDDRTGSWPELHTEMLFQLYRETKVSLENLLPNQVALRVIAASLSERTGVTYDAAAVERRLRELSKDKRFPKLPNDTRFKPCKHVNSEGKRYTRVTPLVRARRQPKGSQNGDVRQAM